MKDYSYLEHMGMGVPRKIVKEMQKNNGTFPDLVEEGELFVLSGNERNRIGLLKK